MLAIIILICSEKEGLKKASFRHILEQIKKMLFSIFLENKIDKAQILLILKFIGTVSLNFVMCEGMHLFHSCLN